MSEPVQESGTDVFVPTHCLRWVELTNKDKILQESWHSPSTGVVEWRDVPTVVLPVTTQVPQ